MPMKINVGLTKKVGLPDYGSLGASCNVEFEVELALLADTDGFHRRVEVVFGACRDAVTAELSQHKEPNGQNGKTSAAARPTNGTAAKTTAANGSTNGNGQGHAASERQMAYLRQLAKQVEGLGLRRLEALSQKMFGKPLAAITGFEASSLIDTVKSIKAAQLDLDAVLNGEAPVR